MQNPTKLPPPPPNPNSTSPMEKVKLMCSFGGKINHRPHDRKLSYSGGDTKILTVDRNINFSNLIAKLNALCESNSEIRLKYKLPGHDLDALVSVLDDDDVDNMFYEYDLLRRGSAASARLRLFIFFPATTPVTARAVNPDFLFGFDKEYANDVSDVTENAVTMTSRSENAVDAGGYADVTPVVVGEVFPVMVNENDNSSTVGVPRGSYVYPGTGGVYTSGYFQAGVNREQAVVYGYVNREQPVVYNFVPVMPSGSEGVGNGGGSPLSYDGTRGEVPAMMNATSNHESKFATGTQLEG